EEWRSRMGLTPREANDALATLNAAGDLAEVASGAGGGTAGRGAFVKLATYEPHLSAEQEQAVAAMLARFHQEPFAPPTRAEVEDALGPELTAALIERGDLVRISDAILLDRAAYGEARRRIVAHLRAEERLTVAEARDLLGTSRKYMVAILEHFDERRMTRRLGDDRVLGPNAPAIEDTSDNAAVG
ncbi:MAG: SelB domain-containing protein, partial [Ktedonobacterales bacterium]